MRHFRNLFGLSRIKRATISLLFVFSQIALFAQSQYYITIPTVQVIAPYTASLADYVNNPSKVVISVQIAAGTPAQKIKLFATLQGDNGVQIKTNASALALLPEITLPTAAGSPIQIVNSLYIRNVFDLESVDIQGTTLNYLQTYGLPAGSYTLNIQAVTAETNPLTGAQAGVPASDIKYSSPFTIAPPTVNVAVRNLQVIGPYSHQLSDFLNTPSKVIITLYNQSTYPQYKIKLLASLKGDNGVEISSNPAQLNLIPDVTLTSGQPTMVLNALSIRNLFDVEAVTLKGISYSDLVNGSGLPEGNYQLCITPVVAEYNPQTQQQPGQILADPRCSAPFPVANLEPPYLINPRCGTEISATSPQNILFTWSLPAGAKPGIQYDFKMVEIWDSTRNPNDAMQSATSPAFFERTVTSNVLLYGPGEPTLTPGNRYAFMVTAVDPNNNIAFRNGGRSEVCYFVYRPKIIMSNIPPENLGFSNNPIGINKNNNPTSVMDAPQLDCSCKSPVSDKTVNNSNAKAGSIVHVGNFDMTLNNDVTLKGDSLSGTGTIPVPFLNSNLLKIRVEFSNLKVNASNQAVSGTVRAKRKGNAASIMPAYDTPNVKPQPFTTKDILNIGNYVSNSANNAIADVNNTINSAGWEMPFGIQKEISGEKITVAITDMTFAPDQAGFNACLAFDIPEGGSNNTLALGAKNICFKDSKSLCGDATLFLVEDFKINALNFTFIKATGSGNTQAGTYAIFDPNGFKQLHIKAEYDFSQNVIVRQSDKGVVKATFETDIKSWNNWWASVNIDPFYVAGYEEWAFKLKSPAFYDHSDSINPPDIPKSAIEGKTNHLDKSWKGFFFSDLEASLPALIKRADNKPISIDVKNFMIDDQGVTGDVDASNVMAISDGSLGGWYYSLDSIGVRFVNSSFIKGGLNGKVLLPTSGAPDKTNQDELDYLCTLSKPASKDSSMKFQFVIQPKNDLHAKLWAATLNLDKTSNITVSNDKGSFNATATLNGDISIEADLSPIPKIDFKAMQFQNLQLMTKSPYISGNVTFGFASPDKSAGGFPVSITGVKPEFNGTTAGIDFNLNISLTDIAALPKGTFSLGVVGDVSMTNGRPSWGNPKLKVDSIKVSGPLGPLDLNGEIDFFDKDPKYGNGIRGGIDVKLSLGVTKIDINSHIMFGNTTFNYWYVDLSYLQSIGTPIVPPVSMFGLGGGVYYNMSKAQDVSPDALLKGTTNDLNRYTPTNNVIGFKASIVVGVGNGTPFHAKGTFSMEFTSQFGVKSVDLDVDAAMMANITDDDNSAPINGHGHIGYDFAQKIFDAGVGLNVNYKIITGSGWLALNINGSNGEWYFKLGEPENRVNVNVLDLATLNAYFMMGSNIPGIPDPPSEILQAFPGYQSSRDNNLVSSTLAPGFAFGAGLQFGPVDLTYLIFYMHFSAGMGFDVNLRQYSQGCDGSSNLPGINGWYANGQFYAWADFAFGLNVDVWFYSGKIDVAEIKAAALFKAGLINPSWFEGWLYGHFDVLNGLISGDMHFHTSVGNKCVPAGNPLGSDMPIISEVNPTDGDKDISIARNPQVAFNYPVDYDFQVTNTNSNGDEVLNTIHIDMTDFTIRRASDNAVIADIHNNQNLSFSDEMKLATLYTRDAFDPQTNYTVTVSVSAYQVENGNKQLIYYKNQPVQETKTITFKTGDCLHRLDENAQTLLGSYPFKNQRYFLQKEQTTGFIQLDKNYPCLLNDPKYDLLAQFISYQSPTQKSVQEVKVGQNGNQLTFPIPTLPNEQITELRIIKRMKTNNLVIPAKISLNYDNRNVYVGSGGGDIGTIVSIRNTTISSASVSNKNAELELYSYYFKTSKFNTLADKLSNADYSATATRDGFGNMEGYSADYNFAEGFDVFDVNETTFDAFGEKYVIYPLVHISEQTPGNAWVQNYVNNYFYSNWKTAYIYGSDYKQDINPAYIRKSATGIQCLIFEPSLEPVGILPMSAEPPLTSQEIGAATSSYFSKMSSGIKSLYH
jgi:TANFOR domain-containing protein